MATFAAETTPYELRAFGDTQAGLGWTLEPKRCAVLVHDLLPYYVNVLDSEVKSAGIDQSQVIVDWARIAGVPIVASAPRPAPTTRQRGLGGQLWGVGPAADQAAQSCLPGLQAPDIPWVHKRSLSAFYATDLEVELRRQGKDQLVVCGVFASQGILATSFDALARDIQFFVAADAVADYSAELHECALTQVARSTGQLLPAADVTRTAS
ncbi:isochorismatase family protein [Hoyosella sp. YIM 151337]|uniref:isochorismatase family protein n=1 Tax=Hoyosella sp. YIM 151337 TaxID=2992742 RepID=UPI002235531E|nr:isochorismatase family protein [Hoyosella sp. YIM 151337]MCW4353030.1 isochorismatase family protein [Hoyosella sp. YIM 151337]